MKNLKHTLARGLDYTNSAREIVTELHESAFDARDIISAPSLTSLSGLGLVIHGTRHIDTLHGVNEIAIGRGFDLLDGFLARALEQESDTGSLIDATADKIALGAIGYAAWKRQIAPRSTLATIAASSIANTSLTSLAAHRHPEEQLRPSPAGKHAMALYNTSLLSYAYASALEHTHTDLQLHDKLRLLGTTTFLAGTAFAAIAANDYFERSIK